MNLHTPRRIRRTGLFELPRYFRETLDRYGFPVAWQWAADAVVRDWRDRELFAGFIALDETSTEVGRGWTRRRAARNAGWSQP